MQRILSQLRVRTGHDFWNYKKSTVRRRIARRMQVQRVATMEEYLASLRENPAEAQALFADLLISVTTFFRDPVAFDKLATLVIPSLFEDKGAGDPLRVWAPGCATGEEAYSIAMLLLEEAAKREIRCETQVFASDLDKAALALAREGRYPLAIEADMTDERLKRFFTRENDHYRVTRELRDMVLFARHSLLKDPPFSRADLISCRNVLIYLDRELQQQVCATFHFALRPHGYLFLGSSESADSPAGLFRALDRESRIYQRLSAPADLRLAPRIGPSFGIEPLPPRAPKPQRTQNEGFVHREALERLAPPSAIVDEAYRVVHLSENAGRYLQPSRGTLVNDITELAREELRFDLRAALVRAFLRNEPSLSGPIAVRFDGSARRVYLHAKPLAGDPNAARAAIVFFFEGEALGEVATSVAGQEEELPGELLVQVQKELQFTHAQLRTSREEYEEANEELRAANEELQSINEEYRSTAEELETSREELQSINEELQTVNSELKTKFESISRAHSDIQNLMAATDVGILFLDTELKINRFTPSITDLFNIAAGDEGRSITDYTHGLEYDGLADDARKVLRDLTSSEREVRGRTGVWYLMRLRPYRTVEDRIDGVVVTFIDIGERRRAEEAMRESEARIRAVLDGVADAIVTTDERGLVQSMNAATTGMFGYASEELIGRDVNILAAEPRGLRPEGTIRRFFETGPSGIIGSSRGARRPPQGRLPIPGRAFGVGNPPRRRAAVHRLHPRPQREEAVRGAAEQAARQPPRLDGRHGDGARPRAEPAARRGVELLLPRPPTRRRPFAGAEARAPGGDRQGVGPASAGRTDHRPPARVHDAGRAEPGGAEPARADPARLRARRGVRARAWGGDRSPPRCGRGPRPRRQRSHRAGDAQFDAQRRGGDGAGRKFGS